MAVTVIEMVGMVGAGKTTLASALCDDLERRGFRALRVEAAITQVLGRSPIGAVARRLLRSAASRRRALRASYRLAVRPWHIMRFAVRHPGLAWSAVRAVSRSPLPVWHRRKILGLFFRPAAAQLYFGPRLRPEEVLLLEEGLVHRAVNLFAWAGDVDRHALRSYLRRLPPTDLVVLVTAPLPVCLARAGSRGLPQRLMGRDTATVTRFMHNAAQIIDGIPDFLHGADHRSVVVDNGGATADAVASLRAALDAHLSGDPVTSGRRATTGGGARGSGAAEAPGPPPPTTPRFHGGVRLRRPRGRRGGAGRRSPRLPPGLVDEVLASVGLRATGPVTALSATSRADNVVVPTSAGPKVVKRYKASVAQPAVAHEHSILRHLAARDFPSPRLAVGPDGHTAHELGGRWYACFDYLPGFFHYNEYLWPPGARERLVGLSARALAALHAALDDVVPQGANPNGFVSRDGPRVRDIAWYLEGLARARRSSGGATSPADFRALLDDAGPLEQELRALDAQLASAMLPRQVIHGDYGPYNLLFRRGARIVVLDFELARIDWRVTDLAKAFQQFGVTRFGLHLPRIARFVAAYEQRCPLQARERLLVPTVWRFLTLRRVAVCLDRFAASEQERWLAEARRKLALAAMIRASTATLSTLGGSGGTRWSA